MEHSKTPWRIEPATKKDNWRIIAANNQVVSTFSGNMDMDNARRIVAAINYCQGLPTKGMEVATSLGKTAEVSLQQFVDTAELCDQLQSQLATERASLFAESQRKQQLEQQVADLVGVLERIIGACDACVADDGKSLVDEFTEEMEASSRAVIQKVRGGE